MRIRVRLAEAVALATTALAFAITVLLVTTGRAAEVNPAAAGLLDAVGWSLTGVLAVTVEAACFVYLGRHRGRFPRLALAGGTMIAAVGLADLVLNLWLLSQTGLPAVGEFYVARYAPPVAIVVVAAGFAFVRPDPREMVLCAPRPSSAQRRIFGAVIVAVMISLSGGQVGLFSPVELAMADDHTDGDDIYEDFNDGDLNGWNFDNGDSSAYSTTTSKAWEGSHSLFFDRSASSMPGNNDLAILNITDSTPSQLSHVVMKTGDSSNNHHMEQIYMGEFDRMTKFSFDNDGHLNYRESSSWNHIADVDNNTFYKIKMTNIDYGSNTFDIEVENESGGTVATVTGANFENSASKVAEIRIYHGLESVDMYYDFYTKNGATPGNPVDGYVKDRDGSAITDHNVTINSSITDNITTSTGYYKFSSVADGDYTIYSGGTGTGYLNNSTKVTVAGSAVRDANITLTPQLTGTVEDENGDTVEGVTLTVNSTSDEDVSANDGGYGLPLTDNTYEVTAGAAGYKNKTKTVTVSGATTLNFTLDIFGLHGTVTDKRTGNPVGDATVKVYNFNFSQMAGTTAEKHDTVDDLVKDWTDPTPPSWNDFNKSGKELRTDLFKNESTYEGQEKKLYVAAHTTEDWNVQLADKLPEITLFGVKSSEITTPGDPRLRPPHVKFDAEEQVMFSCWKFQKEGLTSGLFQDAVDEDLPGTTTGDCEIEITPLTSGGEASSGTITVVPEVEAQTAIKNHKTATADLGPGFYRVEPKANPDASYIIGVGPEGDLEDGQLDELNETMANVEQNATKAGGGLTATAQDIENKIQDQKLQVLHTTTDLDGKWSIQINNSTVKRAVVIAYKRPRGMNKSDFSGDHPSQTEIEGYYNDKLKTFRERVTDGQFNLSNWETVNRCRDFPNRPGVVGSVAVPTQPKKVSVPNTGVNVEVVETPAETGANPLHRLCEALSVAGFLQQEGMANLIPAILSDMHDMSSTELKELRDQYVERVASSPKVCKEALTNLGVSDTSDCTAGPDNQPDPGDDGTYGPGGGDGGIPTVDDDDDISTDEAIDQTRAVSSAVQSLKDTLDPRAEITEVVDGKVTVEWTIPGTIIKNQTSILVDYSNGAGYFLDNDASTVPGTSKDQVTYTKPSGPLDDNSEITVEDFPVDVDGSAIASLTLNVATEEEGNLGPPNSDSPTSDGNQTANHGSDTVRIENPAFEGTIPELQSVSMSTHRPGPNETVRIGLNAKDSSKYGSLDSVSVTGPNGNSLSTTTLSDSEFRFQTDGQGIHRVEATYTNPAGDEFTEVFHLKALKHDIDQPPSIRLKTGVMGAGEDGRYAVVSDGFEDGVVESRRGGRHISVAGIIGQAADPPNKAHLYLTGAEMATESTLTFQLVRGANRETVRKRVQTTLHLQTVSEDAIVYRIDGDDKQPLKHNERNEFGIVHRRSNGTTIETFTGPNGQLELSINNDPSRLDRVFYRARLVWASIDISIPVVGSGVVPSVPGVPAAAVVVLGGAGFLLSRRRWSG